MSKFLKENIALVAGITLPFVLMLLFFGVGKISVVTIAGPKYDLIFTSGNGLSRNCYSASCPSSYAEIGSDGKLKIKVSNYSETLSSQKLPELYLFDHKTLKARRINYDTSNVKEWIADTGDAKFKYGYIETPDTIALNARPLTSGNISPDGYSATYESYSSGGIFLGIFGSGYTPPGFVLKKDGRTIPVNSPDYPYGLEAIGWAGESNE